MSRTPSRDENSASSGLLSRVRASDARAWQKFAALYSPWVYGLARKAGLDESDSADVGQEVFMTAAVRIESFQRSEDGQSMRRWLAQIARNKIGDRIRLLKGQAATFGGASLESGPAFHDRALAEFDSDAEDELPLVRRAIELIKTDFTAQTWECFRRSVLEGQSAAAIAEDLAMAPKAVRQAKYRVLRRLREEFAGLIDIDLY